MHDLAFSLSFTGTVSPNGGEESSNHIALSRQELIAKLNDAINHVLSNGLVTGGSPATLESHEIKIQVVDACEKIEIMAIPVISTAHLDEATGKSLTEDGDQSDWVTCAPYEHGFFIYAEQPSEHAPACLHDLANWLKSRCLGGWVRLEADADVAADLPSYEW